MSLLEAYNRVLSAKEQGYDITEKDIDLLMTRKSRRKIEKEVLKIEGKINGKRRYKKDSRLFPQWVQNVAFTVAGFIHKL